MNKILAGVIALFVVVSGVAFADIQPVPEIGTKAPSFTMTDYEDKEHKLEAYKGKVVVLSFTSQQCPVSRGAEAGFAKLAKSYEGKDVVVLSIDSHKDTNPEEIAEYATEKNATGKKLPYPILKDVNNVYADKMGAKRTPELYVLCKEQTLVYHGAIDNNKEKSDPEYVDYVSLAIDAALAGEKPENTNTSAYGCGIKRKMP
jgi:peroxiredoxin